MPEIKVDLKPEDDRVVIVYIKDQHGTRYDVMIEVLHHTFPNDHNHALQINAYRVVSAPFNAYQYKERNALVVGHGVRLVNTEPCGIWFEFHEIEGKKAAAKAHDG